jgi:NAD(P)-dependent dehydrogenase (short-subunit alcohol dehydrogenase family)
VIPDRDDDDGAEGAEGAAGAAGERDRDDLLAEVEAACDVLERVIADRAVLAVLDEPVRRRLIIAAGRVSHPDKTERRILSRQFRRDERQAVRDADERVLGATGIRVERRAAVFSTPPPFMRTPALPDPRLELGGDGSEPAAAPALDAPRPTVQEALHCYVCKKDYFEVDRFYDQMCPPCAALNFQKRNQTADLTGRVAMVTGSRVKIGYQAAIKLLRAGATVIVTTRFPRDAARRYAAEVDFADWRDRLQIYGVDLRHTPSVEAFTHHLCEQLPRLDYIINNACQTVRRPAGFYTHLIDGETAAPEGEARALLAGNEAMTHASAMLSQIPLLAEDHLRGGQLFPVGQLDADLQQVDLRAINSWRLALADVSTVELLEVQLVNAVAPFVLNARLKPLMLRVPTRDKHIVNVSAMEGQFYRRFKTDKHPHTNMAKAALNMMTRTSAPDYVKDGIHMNSVDTGWVTDEDPAEIAQRKVEMHRFHPPLDIVDGAARIVDPIFHGALTGEHPWGLFFKDYRPTDW